MTIWERREEVLQELKDYNPHAELYTVAFLCAAMRGKMGNSRAHVVNFGDQSIGKSRSSAELAELLQLPKTKVIRGYLTPKALYLTLKAHADWLVVIDEIELTLTEPKSVFLLRSALYGDGRVAYISTANEGEIEDEFRFTGSLVANLNSLKPRDFPLVDRVLFNEVKLAAKDIIEKMRHKATYQPNAGLWALVRERILWTHENGLLPLTAGEKEMCQVICEAAIGANEPFYKGYSTRAIDRVQLLFSCLKTLFGGIDAQIAAFGTELARNYVILQHSAALIDKILASAPHLARSEVVEIVAEERHVSKRQAQRLVAQYETRNGRVI